MAPARGSAPQRPAATPTLLRGPPAMKVSVFGLGYVGTVSAACLATEGHDVVGVDVNPAKLAMIGEGRTPVVEERIGEHHRRGRRLRAPARSPTTSPPRSTAPTSRSSASARPRRPTAASTPPTCERAARGDRRRARDARRQRGPPHRGLPLDDAARHVPGHRSCRCSRRPRASSPAQDFGVAVNPEFLREGTSVKDFYDPPKTVVGELDPASGDAVARALRRPPGPGVPGPSRRWPR